LGITPTTFRLLGYYLNEIHYPSIAAGMSGIPGPLNLWLYTFKLLEHLNIIPDRHSLIRPWSLTYPTSDFGLLRSMRGETSALTYGQLFAKLTSTYPQYTLVYIDRLFVRRYLHV
jgi:hypothetical protein